MSGTRFGFSGQYISPTAGFRTIYTPPLGKVAVLITASLCNGDRGTMIASVGLQDGISGAAVDIVAVDSISPHSQADIQGEWVLTFGDNLYLNTGAGDAWAVNFGGMLYTAV